MFPHISAVHYYFRVYFYPDYNNFYNIQIETVDVGQVLFSCCFPFHYIKLSGSSFIIMQASQTETTKNCLLYHSNKSQAPDTFVQTQSNTFILQND